MNEVPLRLEDGRIVCERCVLANTALARMRGLLGRREFPRGEGLLLRPASSVHMAFMRFPIDAVFLDRHGHVLKIAHELRPWRTAAARRAKAVVELPAGEAARQNIEPGARLVFDAAEAPLAAPISGGTGLTVPPSETTGRPA